MRLGPCLCGVKTYCKGLCKRCYYASRYRERNKDKPRQRRAPGPPECHPERKHEANGLCGMCYQRHLKALHPERYKRHNRTWRKRNPEKARAAIRRCNLMSKFGITVERYDVMLELQGGLCAICRRPERALAKRLAVDHDHVTNAVRGLLCGPCNVVLGYLENQQWMARAKAYLKASRAMGAA